jgi:hypothetical protein
MKDRKRTSLFWKIPKETLREITSTSESIAEIIRKCEMISSGASYKILKRRLDEDQIDYLHIKLGLGSNKGRKFGSPKNVTPLSEILVENSSYSRKDLKRRLVNELGWEVKCCQCGNTGEWCGQKLTIQLDHINGKSNDNRSENLRFMCPNCHSQTKTHSGKRFAKNKCKLCDKKTGNSKTKHCMDCFIKYVAPEIGKRQRRVERPNKDVLLKEIEELGYVRTGKKYGVSDNAIRKWLKVPRAGNAPAFPG